MGESAHDTNPSRQEATSRVRAKGREVLQEQKGLIENISTVMKTLEGVAAALGDNGESKRGCTIRDAFKDILITREHAERHLSVVETLLDQYGCPSEMVPTDFNDWIVQRMDEMSSLGPFDPLTHPDYISLCEAMEVSQGQELHSDDEFIIQGNCVAPNDVCPLTAKNIFELDEPVEDLRGIVYEKEAIQRLLEGTSTNSAVCPMAGTEHRVSLSDLKPARRVIREKQNRERFSAHDHGGKDCVDVL